MLSGCASCVQPAPRCTCQPHGTRGHSRLNPSKLLTLFARKGRTHAFYPRRDWRNPLFVLAAHAHNRLAPAAAGIAQRASFWSIGSIRRASQTNTHTHFPRSAMLHGIATSDEFPPGSAWTSTELPSVARRQRAGSASHGSTETRRCQRRTRTARAAASMQSSLPSASAEDARSTMCVFTAEERR
jgi:hypothetical protein